MRLFDTWAPTFYSSDRETWHFYSERQIKKTSRCLTEHGHVRLDPAAHLLHVVLHVGSHHICSFLKALLDVVRRGLNGVLQVLHLGLQQVVQGGDLCLSVVPDLREVRVDARLHVLHVGRGAGVELVEVVGDVSEGRMGDVADETSSRSQRNCFHTVTAGGTCWVNQWSNKVPTKVRICFTCSS